MREKPQEWGRKIVCEGDSCSPLAFLGTVPYRCASLYLFSASLNRCYSRKFHLDSEEKKDNKALWFLQGAVNKWIHLEAGTRPVCILRARWNGGERGRGVRRILLVIGFDVWQDGNSFSHPAIRYLILLGDPVKITLFSLSGAPPARPSNWGPLHDVDSLRILQKWFLIAKISQVTAGRECGCVQDEGLHM